MFTKFQNRKTAASGIVKPTIWRIDWGDIVMVLLHNLAQSGPQRRPRKGKTRPNTDQDKLCQILSNPHVYVVSRPPMTLNIYQSYTSNDYSASEQRINIITSVDGSPLDVGPLRWGPWWGSLDGSLGDGVPWRGSPWGLVDGP